MAEAFLVRKGGIDKSKGLTATPNDIMLGKTALVNGSIISGTKQIQTIINGCSISKLANGTHKITFPTGVTYNQIATLTLGMYFTDVGYTRKGAIVIIGEEVYLQAGGGDGFLYNKLDYNTLANGSPTNYSFAIQSSTSDHILINTAYAMYETNYLSYL